MTEKTLIYHEGIVPYPRTELVERVQMRLDDARFQHCLRVEQTAIRLAEQNGGDVEKASIAGMCHDYAKQRTADEFKAVILQQHMNPELLEYGNGIWHGVVGAYFVEKELDIHDQEILNAIRRHTIAAPEMTLLDKIVFVADFIEPKRDFPGVEDARKAADRDIDDGVRYELVHTLEYLIQTHSKVYPGTLTSYNAWVPQKKGAQ
ncbi:hypothetical protein IV38_GL000619 [Lactobacillus selangorensis]|uniref:bis(5'-nucleosyl)-tetraphosphatase (symmetrical) n=1 Tax=Lactobacillus selangorensis TaxID=81857 RepID=A0A0R2FMC2_9LACO|nr:bis(5'-nucleosyl)-tetraphosphatase (symmetrical) YqeK [Lactobacillus selangorensis]KRN29731.1 hypothetical protein IV38_GL000619 [Lactobacillus selangorensis]KRN33740.1 hypothetical protein IV40_GL000048 [Lactobacillus selangorensis]